MDTPTIVVHYFALKHLQPCLCLDFGSWISNVQTISMPARQTCECTWIKQAFQRKYISHTVIQLIPILIQFWSSWVIFEMKLSCCVLEICLSGQQMLLIYQRLNSSANSSSPRQTPPNKLCSCQHMDGPLLNEMFTFSDRIQIFHFSSTFAGRSCNCWLGMNYWCTMRARRTPQVGSTS